MTQWHYGDVIMGAIASQITNLSIVYSTVHSDADDTKHQSSASLAFVQGIHRWPVNFPHKWPVTRRMFPFDDVIMESSPSGQSPPLYPNVMVRWVQVCDVTYIVFRVREPYVGSAQEKHSVIRSDQVPERHMTHWCLFGSTRVESCYNSLWPGDTIW